MNAGQDGFLNSRTGCVLVLVGIYALGLGLRMAHWAAISGSPLLFHHHFATEADDYAFYQWAQTILDGDWLGRDTYHPYFQWMQAIAPLETWYDWWGGKEIFHQAPLYPYFLAGLLWACAESDRCVLLLQLLLGSLHPLIIFALGAHLFGRSAGLIAAFATAVYGPFLFYEGTVLRDWLPPLLEPLSVLALLKSSVVERWWMWIAAGGALGLALLAKATILLFLPLVILWLILQYRGSWNPMLSSCAWFLVGLLLCLSPLIARNIAVGAPALAFSNRAAEALAMANAGTDTETMSDLIRASDGGFVETVTALIQDHELASRISARFFKKIQALKDPAEVSNNVSFAYASDFSPLLSWLPGYGLIFPLGLAGLFLFTKNRPDHLLLLCYTASVIGWLLIISPISRYRLVLVPVLITYAAPLCVAMVYLFRQKRVRRILSVAVLLAGCAIVQHGMFRVNAISLIYDHDYVTTARVYAARDQYERAVHELTRLRDRLSATPSSPALETRIRNISTFEADFRTQWAKHLLEEGKIEPARRQAQLVESLYVSNPEAIDGYFNIGLLSFMLGDYSKAEAALELLLALDPSSQLSARARHLLNLIENRQARGS